MESCSNQKSVKQIKIYFIFEILQSSHPLPWRQFLQDTVQDTDPQLSWAVGTLPADVSGLQLHCSQAGSSLIEARNQQQRERCVKTETHRRTSGTLPVKHFRSPTHSRVFLYFYYFLHCRIRVKISKLENNTWNRVVTKKVLNKSKYILYLRFFK